MLSKSWTHWDKFTESYPVFVDECTDDEFQRAVDHFLQFTKMSNKDKKTFQIKVDHFKTSGRKDS